jgi:hypothetical protein
MTRTTAMGIVIGLALGLAVAFGNFGDMLIVALFGVTGFVVAKVLEGASRFLGRSMAGASALGARQTSLTALPKASADVDGSLVNLDLSISVRWPASVPEVSSAVRENVQRRVRELTGLTVSEVSISVTALVTQLPAPPRVH